MGESKLKRNKGRVKALNSNKVENQWAKNHFNYEMKKAQKALAIAKQQEEEKIASGEYQYKSTALRGHILVKKS